MEVADIQLGRSLRWFTQRYVIALSVLAVLAVTAYAMFQSAVAAEKASAAAMNMSARQRTLSQKAALLGVQLAGGQRDGARLSAELARTVDSMEAAHRALRDGSAALGPGWRLSPEVRRMMSGGPVDLDAKLQVFADELRGLTALAPEKPATGRERSERIAALAADVLGAMEVVANELQRESEARVLRLQTMGTLFLSLALLVLLLEGLFIFRPAVAEIRRETEALAEANYELSQMSNADGLTGIANRRLFDETWRLEWERALRERQPLVIIMADIDFFKAYNDTYGHQAGDDCLRQVAKALQTTVKRGTDFVARYGGEEFAVILPNTEPEGALRVGEKLRLAVENMALEHVHGIGGVVTISLGVATATPNKYMARRQLIALADQALYRAKQNGRNRTELLQHSGFHSMPADETDNKPDLYSD